MFSAAVVIGVVLLCLPAAVQVGPEGKLCKKRRVRNGELPRGVLGFRVKGFRVLGLGFQGLGFRV